MTGSRLLPCILIVLGSACVPGPPTQRTQIVGDGQPVSHPEVVWIPPRCAAVVVGGRTIVTAGHCALQEGDRVVSDADGRVDRVGKLARFVARHPRADLAVWTVTWNRPIPHPCRRPTPMLPGLPQVRWISWGAPNPGTKLGASGQMIDADCQPDEMWGCQWLPSWIGRVDSGRVCFSDSGGGVYVRRGSAETDLIGIISGPVAGASELCHSTVINAALNHETIAWLAHVVPDRCRQR